MEICGFTDKFMNIYDFEKQDEHLQETLLNFYSKVFSKIRRNSEKSKPLVYPIDLYLLVERLCITVADLKNRKLIALEDRAVTGKWLIGQGSEEIKISERTYEHLWVNIKVICEQSRFIKKFWSNSNYHFVVKTGIKR